MRLSNWSAGVLLVAGTLVVGCASTPAPTPLAPSVAKPTIEVEIRGCVLGEGGKADRRCDPGVTNPDVTQDTIGRTICRPGWAEIVRPPTSYTSPRRNTEMLLYYPPGWPTTKVRYDHLIPIDLGGHLTNLGNLWPQPVGPANDKNIEGNRLRDRVCAGTLSLAEAQRTILAHWTH